MAQVFAEDIGMETSCVGSEARSILMERYPEIFFLSSYSSSNPYQLHLSSDQKWNARRKDENMHADDIGQEMARFVDKLQLEDVEVLYVFGVGLGHSYEAVKRWLKEKQGRMLIFLEDELAVIDALVQTEQSHALLQDPQVHLQFLQDPKNWNETLKMLVETYPSHRIEVACLESYSKKRPQFCKRIRLKLMRQCAVVNALMTEALYSHHLVVNVLTNVKRWPHSFFANNLKNKFKGIPAIICGAGPSLGLTFPLLKQMEDRALIIAGGSTITALSNQGIVPHLGLALDPNPDEYSRLRMTSAFEMPLLYGTRVQPDVFNTCNGPWGYIHSFTGGPCEAYFEREFEIAEDPVGPDLGPEAFSVTTIAIALAVEMGCSPILLNGIDLAYTGMHRYAAGVMPSSQVFFQELQKDTRASERVLKRKGIQGTMVTTLVKWVMESSSIANYAKAHKEAEFINVSSGGLGFKGISNRPFSEVIDHYCKRTYDLRAMVHHEIEQSRFKELSSCAISGQMHTLILSLEKLLSICDEMLVELDVNKQRGFCPEKPFPSGKMTLLKLDFEEEKAFDCFFPHVGPAIDRLLNRSHPIPSDAEQQEIHLKTIERLITKWEHLKTMIEQEISTLNNLNNGFIS